MKRRDWAILLILLPLNGILGIPNRSDVFADDTEYNKKAAIHLSKANILIREGEIKAAEKELRKAVKEDPESEYLKIRLSDILFQREKYRDVVKLLTPLKEGVEDINQYLYLGLAYQYEGKMEDAVRIYDHVLTSEFASAEDLIHIGRILSLERRYRDALRFFGKAEELLPEDADLQVLIGKTYIALEDIEKARERFKASVEMDPDNIRSWLVLAQLAENDERWEEALDYYGICLGLAKHPSPMLQNILRVSSQMDDYDRAIEISLELVEKYPDNGPLWGTLGVLYFQEGSLEEANNAISRAIEEGVDSFQLYLTLGRSLMELEKNEEAIEYLEKAVALKPDEFMGWINLSLAHFSLKKYEEAGRYLEKAAVLRPESVRVLYIKGLILSRQERYVEAIEPFEKAFIAAPENKDVIFSLAVAYERSGDRGKAEELLERVLEIDPDDGEALNYLGYMWAERGERLDEAGKMIERALEIDPENGYFIDSLAWVYYQKGLYRKALEEILRSVEYVKDDPAIFEHLGDIYQKLGQVEEMSEAWEKALEMDPKNQDLREKLERVRSKEQP